MFCSVKCRNAANGKKVGGRNWAGNTVACENCGSVFRVSPSRLARYNVRTCSRACLAAVQSRERKGTRLGPESTGWKDGRSPIHYRRYLKSACEWCGNTSLLLIHHADENRRNNAPENLVTLCKRCHQRHHAEPRRDRASGQFT